MKKLFCCLLAIAICLGLFACSPVDLNSDVTTSPEGEGDPLSGRVYNGYVDWSDYQRFVATTDLPEDFVYFEDFPLIGTYAGMGVRCKPEVDYYDCTYGFNEYKTNYPINIAVFPQNSTRHRYLDLALATHEPSADMRTVETEKKALGQGYEYWQRGEVRYIYLRGDLYSAQIIINGKVFQISSLWHAPVFDSGTFLGNLLNKETIEDAVQEFKEAIYARRHSSSPDSYRPNIFVTASTREDFLANGTVNGILFGNRISLENLLPESYDPAIDCTIHYVAYCRYFNDTEALYISGIRVGCNRQWHYTPRLLR